MNVLLSCAGRQAFLVEAFRAALGGEGLVIAADTDPYGAAAAVADRAVRAPSIDDHGYVDWMLDLCRGLGEGLLLSLYEEDTRRLETARSALEAEGWKLVGAPLSTLDQTEDKLRTAALAERCGVAHPDTWSAEQFLALDVPPAGPLLAKPRRGRGSRGLVDLADAEAARVFAGSASHPATMIIQSRLEGQEFGLDIVHDLEGRYRAAFVRQKLRMRNGETDVAVTVADADLETLARRIGGETRHQGCLDVDVLRVEGTDHLIDLNVRFGGGYAFSHAAGADLPAALVAWARDAPIDERWLRPRPGVRSARTSTVVTFPTGAEEREP